jgi:hypothetical protein
MIGRIFIKIFLVTEWLDSFGFLKYSLHLVYCNNKTNDKDQHNDYEYNRNLSG